MTSFTLPHAAAPLRAAGRQAGFAAALERLFATLLDWHRRAVERRQLLGLDERQLQDIGISRYDAVHEGDKPFWRA